MAILRYVSDHNETVFGTLVVLFLVTAMLLLIRQIGARRSGEVSGEVGGAIINVEEIEVALKRVLSSQTPIMSTAAVSTDAAPATAAPAGAAASADRSAQEAKLAEALKEREAKIKEMEAELEQTRTIAAALVSPTESAGSGGDPAKLAELEEKIQELKNRLSEYEIIEDDIADLSMYKDQNEKLKKSVDDLRAQLTAAGISVAEAMSDEIIPVAEAAAAAAAPEKKSEQFQIDPNDAVMQEFASTVQVGKAPPPITTNRLESSEAILEQALADAGVEAPAAAPAAAAAPEAPEAVTADEPVSAALEGTLDTDKMLSEVDALAAVGEAPAGDALEESLDTDKLLAEMNSIDASAPAPAAPAEQPAAKPAAPAVPTDGTENFEDDLLAEFKDSKQ
ncbi:MAG TPA: hypothetical protein VM432_12205 [Bdellovibrionales bacterium]|nr:hypothetical protein [Bdellovibrionales bacterium]